MPFNLEDTFVVGISATALFDLSEATKIFETDKQQNPELAFENYRQHMLDNENEPLKDGTGMPLVKALLALNKHQKKNEAPIVEIVVISRNSVETGYRVLKQIRQQKLGITRSAFTAGEPSHKYLDAFYVDLFLTTNQNDAQKITDADICAAAIVKDPPQNAMVETTELVKFAFDADAVIFDDESEIVNQIHGLKEFHKTEDEKQDIPLKAGPHKKLLIKLSKLKARFEGRIEDSPIKLAIFTARNSPAENRVINTLRKWDVYIDEMLFLGGLQKSRFLKVFKPHIFFDDQDGHLDAAASDVPCAKVLYKSTSEMKKLKP